jgi:Domain of unknown function (DUF4276)
MTVYVVPIVEGQTEAQCVERLLQRIWVELLGRSERLQVLAPFRGKRDGLVQADGVELTRFVQKAFLKLQGKARRDPAARSLVLLLLDAEGDCPATLGPRLLAVAQAAHSDATISCVLAKRMLENWIVGGADTLANVNGLPASLVPPTEVEECGGAAWLEDQLRGQDPRRKYAKTIDAIQFIQAMNLIAARAVSPSFDKLCRELERL